MNRNALRFLVLLPALALAACEDKAPDRGPPPPVEDEGKPVPCDTGGGEHCR